MLHSGPLNTYVGSHGPVLYRFVLTASKQLSSTRAEHRHYHILPKPQGDARAQIYITKYLFGMGPEGFQRNPPFIPLQFVNHSRSKW